MLNVGLGGGEGVAVGGLVAVGSGEVGVDVDVGGIGVAVQVGVAVDVGVQVGVDVYVEVGAGVELGKGISLGVGETGGTDVAVAEGAVWASAGFVATTGMAEGAVVGVASGVWQPLRSSRLIVVSRAMCLVHIGIPLPFANGSSSTDHSPNAFFSRLPPPH